MRITKSFLSLSVLLFGVSRAYPQEVTPQEVWSSFTAAERYVLASPTMTYRYGGVSATSQIFAERQAVMQAERDAPLYPAFLRVQAVIDAVNAAAEEHAAVFASTQDVGEFWQRYNSVSRGWVPEPISERGPELIRQTSEGPFYLSDRRFYLSNRMATRVQRDVRASALAP
jgi:hypothetical protein